MSSSSEFDIRNMRSITKLDLFVLSEYLVGIWLVCLDKLSYTKSTCLENTSLQ